MPTKYKIGLNKAESVEAALEKVFEKRGNHIKIGVVTHGADIYFKLKKTPL